MRIPTYNAKIKYLDAQISKKIFQQKKKWFLKIKKKQSNREINISV